LCEFAGLLRKATTYDDLRRTISVTASTSFAPRVVALTTGFFISFTAVYGMDRAVLVLGLFREQSMKSGEWL
jgi:hypothetical protein